MIVGGWEETLGTVAWTQDYRATSEVFTDTDNRQKVKVAREADWYAWQADRRPDKPQWCPRSRIVLAYQVWVEDDVVAFADIVGEGTSAPPPGAS